MFKDFASLASYSLKEKLFIVLSMICAFCICAEYAVIRPVSNSVFIQAYGSKLFPYAWLATIPLNFLIISLYNRYLSKIGVWRMFLSIACFIVCGSLFCTAFLPKIHSLPFVYYIWKEVYIMLMLQQLWSIINTSIDMKKAKYLYGIIFGVGGAGGAFGSLLPGFFAVKMGSESLLLFTLPIYAVLLTSFYFMLKYSHQDIKSLQTKETPSFWEGIQLLSSSRYLIFILCLVVFMQLSSTIVDYQFQHFLERTILDKDLRTEFSGRLLGIVNGCSVALQFVGTFLLVHFLGLRRSHFMIPLMLGLNSIAFLLFPVFGVISFSFVTIKTFDFSLFGVIREILYIPLSTAEKFKAKAVIEVFAHRSAKSIASFLILTFQFLAAGSIVNILSWTSLIIFAGWSALVFLMFKKLDIVRN